MYIESEVHPLTKIVIAVLIFVCIGFALIQSNLIFDHKERPDTDCIEWGVEKENRFGDKTWANIYTTPKDRDEAEQIAKQLESQDVTGSYFTAKCKKWRN